MHLSPSIGAGKAPMDVHLSSITLLRQSFNMLPQMLKAFDALGQTVALKNADLDLGHVEPTPMLRGIMHLQALPKSLGFLRLKRLIQAGCCMRVQMIHHQANTLGLGIDLINQPADGCREIQPGASLGHFQTTETRLGFNEDKQVGGPQPLIFIIAASGRPWFERQWLAYLPMHDQWFLVKADHWLAFLIGLSIQMQDLLHRGNLLCIYSGNAPLLMLPRLQFIFFSNWRIVSGEIDRTYPNSTALPASMRRVQWSRPSSTSLQVMAIKRAACSSVSACRRRSCRLSVSTASTPPVPYRRLTLRMVCSEILSASLISALLHLWSHLSKTRARVNVRALDLPRRIKIWRYSFSSLLSWTGAVSSNVGVPVFAQLIRYSNSTTNSEWTEY